MGRINANGTYTLPASTAVDAATGAVRVRCESGSLGTLAGSASAVLLAPSPSVSFAFGATGRVIYSPPGAAPYDLFVQARGASAERRVGFRVLSSGITCAASVGGDPAQCDVE